MVVKRLLPSDINDMNKRAPFKPRDVIKILLWCERHCCLCEKPCDTNIEIHHIEREGSKRKLSNIENAIPLCFDCHGRINSYNPKHGVGTAYKVKEIKARRDQIYEKHTRHLVPVTFFEITQVVRMNPELPSRQLPDVGFNLKHVDPRFLPVTAKVEVRYLLDQKYQGMIEGHNGYYNGETDWHLNPTSIIFGHFSVPEKCVTHEESGKDFKIEVQVTIVDQYGRPHRHLPQAWTYVPTLNYWYIEPRSFTKWT